MNSSRARSLRVFVYLCCCFAIMSACHRRHRTGPAPTYDQLYYTHTIQFNGETMAMIARWYTGASSNWQQLVAENPEINPRKMKKGMEVRIPRNLLVREDPLPRSMMMKSTTPNATGVVGGEQPPADVPQANTQSPADSGATAAPGPSANTVPAQPSDEDGGKKPHRSKEELLNELTKDY